MSTDISISPPPAPTNFHPTTILRTLTTVCSGFPQTPGRISEGGCSPSYCPRFPLPFPTPPYYNSSCCRRHNYYRHWPCLLTGSLNQGSRGTSTVPARLARFFLCALPPVQILCGVSKYLSTRRPPRMQVSDNLLLRHGRRSHYFHHFHLRRRRPLPTHTTPAHATLKHLWLVPCTLNVLVIALVGGGGRDGHDKSNKQTLSVQWHKNYMTRSAVRIDAILMKSEFSVFVETRIGCQISYLYWKLSRFYTNNDSTYDHH